MSYELHRPGNSDSEPAGAPILPRSGVILGGTSVPMLLPLATNNQRPDGFSGLGTTASGLSAVYYLEGDICQAVAAASFANGAEVMLSHVVGSAPGLVPAAGVSAAIVASGMWIVGKARQPAVAGDIFALEFAPRKAA